MEFIGSKRIHASSEAIFSLAAREGFPEFFERPHARENSENHTLEWTNKDGISGTLEVKPNGPSQADLTLKVQLEPLAHPRAEQMPTLIETALERLRNALEAEQTNPM